MTVKPPKKFVPFTHEDLELKQELLKYARDIRAKEGFENGLASALIYSSFAEYLSENLLINLRHFIYEGTYNRFSGILFIDERNNSKSKKTLGQTIGELDRFNFPDKEGVLQCLRKITESRNNVFHKFAKADISDLEKILVQDLSIISNETEDLVNKIDVIYTGLKKILIPNIPALEEADENSSNGKKNK